MEESTHPKTPTKRKCIPAHHCPVCDRFKKVVRGNVRNMLKLFESRPDGYWCIKSKEEGTFWQAVSSMLVNINRALEIYEIRRVQSMTDEEAEIYLADRFLRLPEAMPRFEKGSVQRVPRGPVRLTLIRGGMSAHPIDYKSHDPGKRGTP